MRKDGKQKWIMYLPILTATLTVKYRQTKKHNRYYIQHKIQLNWIWYVVKVVRISDRSSDIFLIFYFLSVRNIPNNTIIVFSKVFLEVTTLVSRVWYISSFWDWKGVTPTPQDGRYTLSIPKWRYTITITATRQIQHIETIWFIVGPPSATLAQH